MEFVCVKERGVYKEGREGGERESFACMYVCAPNCVSSAVTTGGLTSC